MDQQGKKMFASDGAGIRKTFLSTVGATIRVEQGRLAATSREDGCERWSISCVCREDCMGHRLACTGTVRRGSTQRGPSPPDPICILARYDCIAGLVHAPVLLHSLAMQLRVVEGMACYVGLGSERTALVYWQSNGPGLKSPRICRLVVRKWCGLSSRL